MGGLVSEQLIYYALHNILHFMYHITATIMCLVSLISKLYILTTLC